jgi:hypothetical protein
MSLSKRNLYVLLLFLMSLGAFGIFSELEINIFVKAYVLLLTLQGGFALIYLKFYRVHH